MWCTARPYQRSRVWNTSPSESPGSIKAFVADIPTPFNGSGLGHERLAQCKHSLNLAFAQESPRHGCRNFCCFYKKQVDDFTLCKRMAKQQMVAMTTHPPIVQINDRTVGIIAGHAASSLLDRTDDLVTRRRSQSVGKPRVLKSKNSTLLSSWLSRDYSRI